MLTPKGIESAIKKAPPGSESWVTDGAAGRGTGTLRLNIRALPSGVTATWFALWKQGGRQYKMALGRYPDLPLAKARERMRDEVTPVLLAGKNPRAVVTGGDKPTVERLFQGYVDAMKAAGKSSAGNAEHALLTGKYAAAETLGRARLAGAIEPGDIANALAKTDKRGARSSADHLRRHLSAAFNWGIKATHDYRVETRQDWGIKFNPVTMVKRDAGAVVARDRSLTAQEIKTLWDGLAGNGYAPDTTAAVRLLLLCGQRVRETLRVEGREIDLAAGVWNMPAHKTKGGKFPHAIPLPALAVEVFREQIKRRGGGYLFPLRGGDGNTPATEGGVSRALRRFITASGMDPFQLRDLRRTWKSRAGEAGVDRFTRDLIQQHAKTDTGSKHYDRADYLPQMREAMKTWEAYLCGIIGTHE